jgi:hypothetical protein
MNDLRRLTEQIKRSSSPAVARRSEDGARKYERNRYGNPGYHPTEVIWRIAE